MYNLLSLENWNNNWTHFNSKPPDESYYYELINHYNEPTRHYHTLKHINECLLILELNRKIPYEFHCVYTALWFHDVIYDTHRSDNEVRSADFASKVMEDTDTLESVKIKICNLILATEHNGLNVGYLPRDPDLQLIRDIDLLILTASQAEYDEYEKQIRLEYSWVPREEYIEGRKRILTNFLLRKKIFTYFDQCDDMARENILRALKNLKDIE